jgi:hypothetical protein
MSGISLGVLSSGALAAAERSEGERSEPQRSGAAAKAVAGSRSIGPPDSEQRQIVLDRAYRTHPERFVRQTPRPAAVPSEVWINKPPNLENKTQ